MSTTVNKTLPAFEWELPSHHKLSNISLATIAFFAMLKRDLVVMGRQLLPFLLQVLVQPMFLFFIFGKVLPIIGFANRNFGAIFLPGVVGFTVLLISLQSVMRPLVLDLGYAREIDDRLLAPLPVQWVAVEKIVFAAFRGLSAGVTIFPLAFVILGSSYHVCTDRIGLLIGIMVLAAFAGATIGMTIGTLIRPEQIGLMFSLILMPMIFLGCTYYPWSMLDPIKWFQIITLFNPLTYVSEGLRYAMVLPINTSELHTLGIGWVLLALSTTVVVFLMLSVQTFYRRVIT